MSAPEVRASLSLAVGQLPDLPRDGGEPVFFAPWQAQAFALTLELCARGHFRWPEWVDVFSRELREGPVDPSLDAAGQYYAHWLAALEHLATAKGLTDRASLGKRRLDWEDAYRHAPHGQPVRLADRRAV